jgi:hypothetical protein
VRRLLADEPNPPRAVALRDVWSVYAPLVIYQVAGLPVVFAIVEVLLPPKVRVPLAIGFLCLLVIEAAFWTALIMWVRSILVGGIGATAEVLKAGRLSGRLQVMVDGREMAMRDGSGRLRGGDHVMVVLDPRGDKIQLSLGAP